MNKKNLLFVFADQWRGSAIGYAGEDPVQTPVMDRFCEESVYCDHAFSTFPLCSPHRASLLTGRYPLSTGFFTNCKTGLSMRLQDGETGIGQVLKDAGYQTAYIGKWHLDEPERNRVENPASGAMGWDAFTPPGVRRHGFDYWYSYGAWDAHLHPHYWRDTPDMIRVDQWSVEHETDAAIRYLECVRDKERPFAMYISWNPPHSPYDEVPDQYLDIFEGRELRLRGNVQTDHLHHHTEEAVPGDRADLERTTRQYYAAVAGLDEQFGRLIDTLKREGLYEDTVIVLSSDHGDMMGSHGLMGKHAWYEESVRIPFVVRNPGTDPHTCTTCIGSQDMMPTVLGLLDVPVPDSVEGEDCSHILESGEEDPDKVSFLCACPGRALYLDEFSKAGMDPMRYGWRGVRTARYTYVMDAGYHPVPQPECLRYLYDNELDPLQQKPLDLETEENKALAERLERMTVDWMKAQQDHFICCEGL